MEERAEKSNNEIAEFKKHNQDMEKTFADMLKQKEKHFQDQLESKDQEIGKLKTQLEYWGLNNESLLSKTQKSFDKLRDFIAPSKDEEGTQLTEDEISLSQFLLEVNKEKMEGGRPRGKSTPMARPGSEGEDTEQKRKEKKRQEG